MSDTSSAILNHYQRLHRALEQQLFNSVQHLLNEHGALLPAEVTPQDGWRVLEVACDMEEWVYALARAYPAIEVTGLDGLATGHRPGALYCTPSAQYALPGRGDAPHERCCRRQL